MADNRKVYSDLSFTPSPNNEGDLTQVYDKDAINQSLFNIMHTKKGSRAMDPDYGCNFQYYLFDPFDMETANKMLEDIYKNFIAYEPRINILSIDRNLNYDSLQYTFNINYEIINKNQTGNFSVVLQKL